MQLTSMLDKSASRSFLNSSVMLISRGESFGWCIIQVDTDSGANLPLVPVITERWAGAKNEDEKKAADSEKIKS